MEILHVSAEATLRMGGRWVVVSFGMSPCLSLCEWYLQGLEAFQETSIRAVHPQLEAFRAACDAQANLSYEPRTLDDVE